MEKKDLKKGIIVRYRENGKRYRVDSAKCRFKVPETGEWVDGVLYVPLYENPHDCFMREVESFLGKFDVEEEERPADGGLTYEEALVSLIAMVDTPIMSRKFDIAINECIRMVKAELVKNGTWDRLMPKEDNSLWDL